MGIPLSRLKEEVNSKEFSLYMAFDKVDPFGKIRDDLSAGIICDTLVKVNGVKGTKPSDFMPEFDAEVKKKDPKELFLKLKMATAGKVKKD